MAAESRWKHDWSGCDQGAILWPASGGRGRCEVAGTPCKRSAAERYDDSGPTFFHWVIKWSRSRHGLGEFVVVMEGPSPGKPA